ncbi:MAG: HAMP domain-containing sensor histidine kinase [Pigmentiphaga sp.]
MKRNWRDLFHSMAFRMAVGFGGAVFLCMIVVLSVLYVRTIGEMHSRMDDQLQSTLKRLQNTYQENGLQRVIADIQASLEDGVHTDSEGYLLMERYGRKLAGNMEPPPLHQADYGNARAYRVLRDGRPSVSRLRTTYLSEGLVLTVARDLQELDSLDLMMRQAMLAAALVALLLAGLGAVLLQRHLEREVAVIRRVTQQVQEGDLSQRIDVFSDDDEFSRLSHDINGMLDRIEVLMQGVRHVSNTIAHNLRTPLSRIRATLDQALTPGQPEKAKQEAMVYALRQVEGLSSLFEKLLQIAEAETGMRTVAMSRISISDILLDVIDLYEPLAEEQGITIQAAINPHLHVTADRDLLGSALANLLDNALKYAGPSAVVQLRAWEDMENVWVEIEDNGPGVSAAQLEKMGLLFQRGDTQIPGHGLGLASVKAIMRLLGASLAFEHAEPGLRVRLGFPGNLTKR